MLIVLDSTHPLFRNSLCIDPEIEFTGCGHAIHVRLAREAKLRGIDVVTADVYLAMKAPPKKVACLTDMMTPLTDKVLAKGAYPMICMSLESPINAKMFYHKIVHYAGKFRHNYQFNGTQNRLTITNTIFHPIVFPIETRIPLPLIQWKERDFLIVVNSNKRAVFQKWDSLKATIKSVLVSLYNLFLKLVDPWMRIREVYKDRIEGIKFFSHFLDFSLFGLGWNLPIQGFSSDYQKAALKTYKGAITSDVRSKREVMSGFKFALCFENCVFPGYITEKIFDCFLSGCIPIYYGAPDIADFVPHQTFIDFRMFENYNDLNKYLRNMTESDADHYINAARDFLTSETFEKYTVDHFVNDVLNVIEQEFKQKG